MKKSDLINEFENLIPLDLAEPWDNSGIQIINNDGEVNRVLIALEISDEIIDEAIEMKADLIITHHPLIFNKISSLNYSNSTSSKVIKLVKNNIDVYSCHTNFDKIEIGNNFYLGSLIGLTSMEKCKLNGEGYLVKGQLSQEIIYDDVIDLVSEKLNYDKSKFSGTGRLDKKIKQVCICTGAGGEFVDVAISEECDLFITGDLKYHQAQLARETDMCVLDCGHYATERPFIWNMYEILSKKFPSIVLGKSKADIDPFSF